MIPEVPCIPPDIVTRLEAFCLSRKAGRVVMDINDGRIVGWEITEKGRVRNGA